MWRDGVSHPLSVELRRVLGEGWEFCAGSKVEAQARWTREAQKKHEMFFGAPKKRMTARTNHSLSVPCVSQLVSVVIMRPWSAHWPDTGLDSNLQHSD